MQGESESEEIREAKVRKKENFEDITQLASAYLKRHHKVRNARSSPPKAGESEHHPLLQSLKNPDDMLILNFWISRTVT